MSGQILTFLLCFVVILIAGNSYRRREGSQAPASPRGMILLAVALVLAALIGVSLLFVRRHVG